MMNLVHQIEPAVVEIARERAAIRPAPPKPGPVTGGAIDVGFHINHPKILRHKKVICGSDLALAQARVKVFAIAARVPDASPIARRTTGISFDIDQTQPTRVALAKEG